MKKEKKKISLFAKISFVIFIISVSLLILSELSESAANFLNDTVSHLFRRAMAAFGDLFPFSLFELLLFLLIPAAVIVIVLIVRAFLRAEGRVRLVTNLLSVALLLYSGNAIALGIAYNATPVDERMSLSSVEVTKERLADSLRLLTEEVNTLSRDITYSDGRSVSGYTLAEMSEKICDSYENFSEEYGFPHSFYSTAKSAGALNILSYLGLGGIYTYYTGEANVNTGYPDFDVVFTAAHELSHQRGVLPENEANFMAYLVCSRSEDVYLRYSAALNMFSYVGSALWRTDSDLYYEILATLSKDALSDLRASSSVTAKYGDTVVADISSFINDLFLKSNGTAGTVTYGRVVTLYISYLYS